MQYRAMRDAASAGRMLIYSQAIDASTKKPLDRAEYRRALQVVNMTNTGKLLGMCPLFVGMRVRLNAKLSAKHGVVHDAVGTVVDIKFHEKEDLSWQQEPDHPARKAGHVVLRYLPKAVLVKFDHLADQDVGFEGRPGVVAVEPHGNSWKYKTHDRWSGDHKLVEVPMRRYQIPLAPEKVRTVQTAQGLTMDAAAIFLGRPRNMSEDDYWMHLYVMLSRVRMSENIMAYELPPMNVFTRGPPGWVREGMDRLEGLATETQPAVAAARRRLGRDLFRREAQEATRPVSSTLATQASVPDTAGKPAGSGIDRLEEELAARRVVPGRRSGVSQKHQGSLLRYEPLSYLTSVTAGVESDPRVPGRELLRSVRPEGVRALYGELPVCCDEASMLESRGASGSFENPAGTHSCFVNVALQVFLRLKPVHHALLAHAEKHREKDGAGGFKPRPDCVACALAEQAVRIRQGRAVDSTVLREMVQRGCFGSGGGFGSSLPVPADASELLLGSSSFESEHPAASAEKGMAVRDICDGLLGCLAAWERSQTGVGADGVAAGPEQDIFRSFVFGCLQRRREHCLACRACSDRIEATSFVEVPSPGKEGGDLVELLEQTFSQPSPSRATRPGGRACRCSEPDPVNVVRHAYLEREPPVLILRVQRNVGGVKNTSAIRFPEVLTCLRTGKYRLAGAILHHGKATGGGHFRAVCSRGEGRYVLYDDKKVKEVSWSFLDGMCARREVYLLLYARTSFWKGAAGDGTERTPYSRPAACVHLANEATLHREGLSLSGSEERGGQRSQGFSDEELRKACQEVLTRRSRIVKDFAAVGKGRSTALRVNDADVGRVREALRKGSICLGKLLWELLRARSREGAEVGEQGMEVLAREFKGYLHVGRSQGSFVLGDASRSGSGGGPPPDPATKRPRLAGDAASAPPSSEKTQSSSGPRPRGEGSPVPSSLAISGREASGLPSNFWGDMPEEEVWAVEDFPGSIEGARRGVDWRGICRRPAPSGGSDSPSVATWASGLVGFRNSGADCWMIAVVQMLGSSKHVRDRFLAASSESRKPGVLALRSAFADRAGVEASYCLAAQRKRAFGFSGGAEAQEDAEEGLTGLLRAWGSCYPMAPAVFSGLLPPAQATPVYDFFGVLTEQATGCFRCRVVNKNVEEHLRLMVPPPPASSAGLATTSTAIWASTYGCVERLQDDTLCSNCDVRGFSVQRNTLKKVGSYLLLQLGVYDMALPGRPKLLDSFIEASPQIEVVVGGGAVVFKLLSAVEHIGSDLRSGHYVAYRREAKGGWRVLNDDGRTRVGPPHMHIMSDEDFRRRQMYLCLYACSSSEPASSSSSALGSSGVAGKSAAAASSASSSGSSGVVPGVQQLVGDLTLASASSGEPGEQPAAKMADSVRAGTSPATVEPGLPAAAAAEDASAAVAAAAEAAPSGDLHAHGASGEHDQSVSDRGRKRMESVRCQRQLRQRASFHGDDPNVEAHDAHDASRQPKAKAKRMPVASKASAPSRSEAEAEAAPVAMASVAQAKMQAKSAAKAEAKAKAPPRARAAGPAPASSAAAADAGQASRIDAGKRYH